MTNLIIDLSFEKIKINVTAVFTFKQVKKIIDNINNNSDVIISVFAGRIADTGIDPEVIVARIVKYAQFKKILRFSGQVQEKFLIYTKQIDVDVI